MHAAVLLLYTYTHMRLVGIVAYENRDCYKKSVMHVGKLKYLECFLVAA